MSSSSKAEYARVIYLYIMEVMQFWPVCCVCVCVCVYHYRLTSCCSVYLQLNVKDFKLILFAEDPVLFLYFCPLELFSAASSIVFQSGELSTTHL